jgi:hypothetical protein
MMPAWRRASSDGARWALAKPMASPAASRTRTMASRAMPSSCPADARSASGTLSVLSGLEAKAQKATSPPQKALVASTATPRRRSGTMANHTTHPHASASRAPRE